MFKPLKKPILTHNRSRQSNSPPWFQPVWREVALFPQAKQYVERQAKRRARGDT